MGSLRLQRRWNDWWLPGHHLYLFQHWIPLSCGEPDGRWRLISTTRAGTAWQRRTGLTDASFDTLREARRTLTAMIAADPLPDEGQIPALPLRRVRAGMHVSRDGRWQIVWQPDDRLWMACHPSHPAAGFPTLTLAAEHAANPHPF